jgi:hypothetical protein
VLAVVVAATAVVVLPQLSGDSAARYEATHEPEAAARFVAVHLPGHRLYSIDTWGGYLAGRFPTGRVVFVYDETAVFGTTALQQYLDIHDLRPDWTTVLNRNSIADAIVPAASQEVSALQTLGWVVDCRDGSSGSVVMSGGGTATGSSSVAGAPACA